MDLHKLRKVNKSDSDLLFKWTNDPEVRKWSFSSNKIKKNEHMKWLQNKIIDKNVLMWIFIFDQSPSGLVRFEKDKNKAILNYQIASEFRGKGLASIMLDLAIKKIQKHWKNFDIIAYTMSGNLASNKSLLKSGFKPYGNNKNKKSFIYQAKNMVQ